MRLEIAKTGKVGLEISSEEALALISQLSQAVSLSNRTKWHASASSHALTVNTGERDYPSVMNISVRVPEDDSFCGDRKER